MLVTLDNVNWTHSGKILVKNVSLTVNSGEIVTIIGPNGAGKSSLLKLITGLATPTTGTIQRQPKLRIGYMPQRLSFDGSLPMTVDRFLRLTRANDQARAAAVERLDMGRTLPTQLQSLSGGELQRVLLARALLVQPHLFVLDEPTQGVDVTGQAELYHLIAELRDELGCGVLMVSHDLHLVMAQTDSVICLNKHVCCHGTPESVEQHPEYLQLFGKQAAKDIAVYTHHHDHEHDVHGRVIPAKGSPSHTSDTSQHDCGHHHD